MRFATQSFSTLLAASLAFGAIAVAQAPAPAAPATTPDPAAAPAAPVERRAPRPPQRSSYRPSSGRMDQRRPEGGFHGPQGHMGPGMGTGFHIAPPGMWWRSPSVVQRLTLTPEQTKKMDDIFQQSRIQLIDLKANVEKQNVMLEPLLSANPPDTAKALAQIDKVAQARADLEKADARMLLGIRGVLTPDQWTKLQSGQRGMGYGAPGGGSPGAGGPAGPGDPAAGGPGGRGRGPRVSGGPGAPNGNDLFAPQGVEMDDTRP